MRKTTEQTVLFPEHFTKPTLVTFDAEHVSSDGGGVLLGAVDRGLGLTEHLCTFLEDPRDWTKTDHSYLELLRQRVYSIALGYSDCNDAARVGNDPVLKALCGRSPVRSIPLGSQPTLSRFENTPTARELVRLGRAFEDFVIDHQRKVRGRRVRKITIDLDPSRDATHGQQTFAFFNGYYDTWCYLPLFGFLTFDDDPEQCLFHARLRPGTARDYRGAIPLLRRTVCRLRRSFPRARIRVRLDAGFAWPRLFDALDELDVDYLVALQGNKRLHALAEPWMSETRRLTDLTGESERTFGAFSYATCSWPHERRVLVKAEIVHHWGRKPRENPRFVVTNLMGRPEALYETYCGRGDVENRIKEMQNGLLAGRTSCSRFLANDFRVLLTATAYALFQEIRRRASRSDLRAAQVQTIRERLLKIGARVVESVRRVVLHLPAAYPWKASWWRIAGGLGCILR